MSAENELDYTVKLEDQMSSPAQQAGKSLSALALELIETKKAAGLLQQQIAAAKKSGDAGAFTAYGARLGEQKQKLAELTTAQIHARAQSASDNVIAKQAIQNALAKAKATKDGARVDMAAAQANSASLKASMAEWSTFKEGLTAVASEAAIALGVIGALTAAVVALGFVAVKLGTFAIEATQSKQALVATFGALAGGEAAGVRLEGVLSDLSDKIGITKDELAPLAAKFEAMGFEGEAALKKVTLAAISARALTKAAGIDGAAAFEALTRKVDAAIQTSKGLEIPAKGLGSLAEMGIRVVDVAKRMGISAGVLGAQLKAGTADAKKFGVALQDALIEKGAKPLQLLGMRLENIKGIFAQSIGDLFEDLEKDADPFLLQMKDLLGLFSQTSFIGQAMKSGVGGGMKLFFQLAQQATREFEIFFLKVIEYSANTYVFLKKHWGAVKFELLGVAIAVGVVAAALAVTAALFVGPFVLAAAAVGALVFEIGNLYEEAGDLYDSAVQWGADLAKGFISGITSFASQAKDATVTMAKDAWQGAKDFLGIHSPSRVMMSLGEYTGVGFAAGIGKSHDKVRTASEGMSDVAVGGAVRGTHPGDFPSSAPEPQMPMMMQGGNKGTSIGDVTVNITAPNGVTDATKLTEIGLATLLERLVLQQGV